VILSRLRIATRRAGCAATAPSRSVVDLWRRPRRSRGEPYVGRRHNRYWSHPRPLCLEPYLAIKGWKCSVRNTIEIPTRSKRRYLAVAACHHLSEEIRRPLYLVDSMFSLMVHGVESPLTSSSAISNSTQASEMRLHNVFSTGSGNVQYTRPKGICRA
jgi:hypothetical protein